MLSVLFAPTLFAQITPVDDFHCPESYATDAERENAIKAFVEGFEKQHPQASIDDLAAERVRLLVAHECRQTLAHLAANQQPEKAALTEVSPQTQRLTLASHEFTRVDEYYDTATRVWSVIFVDDPQHPDSYANQIILNFYDSRSDLTVEAVATMLSEERRGTKNVFLFQAPDEPGGEITYHIVSVTQGRSNFVNIMKVASCESSVVNIEFGHRLSARIDLPKAEEEARQWLKGADGEAWRGAVASVRAGPGWREYLKHVK